MRQPASRFVVAAASALGFALLAAGATRAAGQDMGADVGEVAPDEAPLMVDRPAAEFVTTAQTEPVGLPDRAAIEASLSRCVDFLIEAQNDDGSWGSWDQPAHEFWSNPSTHHAWITATTALGILALADGDVSARAGAAADRGLQFLLDAPDLKRPSDWDVDHTWGAIYGLQVMAAALGQPRWQDERWQAGARRKAAHYVELLADVQSPDGGWGYYDFDTLAERPSWSTSFSTAVAVLALHDAAAQGIELPDGMLEHAVTALERCLLPSGAYTYSVMAVPQPGWRVGINQVKGSLSRMQVGNLALVTVGSPLVDRGMLTEGLEQFFTHHRFLDVARGKPVPHEAYYQNSGYFYFFGHYYAARVLELLDPAEQARYRARLAREIVKTQEADGSMWDFYINTYHRPYGTAFGAMTLRRSLPREAHGR